MPGNFDVELKKMTLYDCVDNIVAEIKISIWEFKLSYII